MVKDQRIEMAWICCLSVANRASSAEVMLHLIQRMRKLLTWLNGVIAFTAKLLSVRSVKDAKIGTPSKCWQTMSASPLGPLVLLQDDRTC